MNTKLIDSLLSIINSLTIEEKKILEEKLCFEISEVTTIQIMQLAQANNAFDFLEDEPDIYSLDDGEPV